MTTPVADLTGDVRVIDSDPPNARGVASLDGPTRAKTAAIWAFIAQASVALANLPVTFMLARALSPAGLGSFQLLNRLALLAISVAHLGYPHAFAWAAAKTTERVRLRALCRRALLLSVGQGAIVFGVAISIAAIGWDPGGFLAWVLIAAYPLANLITVNLVSLYRGMLSIRTMTAIRFSQALCWLILTSYLFSTNELTVTSAIATLLVSQVVAVVVALAWSASDGLLFGRAETREFGSLRRFSLRVFPGLAIRDWNIYLDQVIVGVFFSPRLLGLYSVAVAVTVSLGMLATPFINTAQPIVQRTHASARLRAASRLAAAAVGSVAVPALVLAGVAPVLVPWAYGHAYADATILVQVLCAATVLDVANATLHGVLLGLDQPSASSRATALGLVANVLAWLIFLPTLGVLGAALTSVIAYLIVAAFMTRAVCGALNCHCAAFARAVLDAGMDHARTVLTFPATAYARLGRAGEPLPE